MGGDDFISGKQIEYLKSLFPNCLMLVNRVIEWPVSHLKNISKKDLGVVIEYFRNLGCFIPIRINKDLYILEEIECRNEVVLYKQINTHKQTDMKVVLMERVLMIDWDDIPLIEIKRHLVQFPQYTFIIYETFKGFHGYCVSHFFKNSIKTCQLMKDLKCDSLYIEYTHVFGFITRASKKLGRSEPFIERILETIGDAIVVPEIVNMLRIKDHLITREI